MSQRHRTTKTGLRAKLASDERLMALVQEGDSGAFEALYERSAGELLSFCIYMLGSRQDAEDALQATFTSAYRALRADRRPVTPRPWMFAIARNQCLSILRKRRPTVELNGEPALGGDPVRELELREELGQVLASLRELPESQRAALVLAELHGLSQGEIATVLGVRSDQVKAFVYQARSNLLSERAARDAGCKEIREELSTARGPALLKGRLRRHLRSCADCRSYADSLAGQRRRLGALLPFVPSLVLKYRALEEALGIGSGDPATYAGGAAVGGSVAAGAAEIAGGGVKALAVKVAAGVAVLGAGASVGVSVLEGSPPHRRASSALVASAEGSGGRTLPTAGQGPGSLAGASAGEPRGRPRVVNPRARTNAGLDQTSHNVQPSPSALRNGGRAVDPETEGISEQRADDESPRVKSNGNAPRAGGQSAGGRTPASEEERARQRQEHKQANEALRKEREARPPGSGSRPPKSEEERARKREERNQPVGHSRSPKSVEERREKREEHRRQREAESSEETAP